MVVEVEVYIREQLETMADRGVVGVMLKLGVLPPLVKEIMVELVMLMTVLVAEVEPARLAKLQVVS